jgi:hypothetical protein
MTQTRPGSTCLNLLAATLLAYSRTCTFSLTRAISIAALMASSTLAAIVEESITSWHLFTTLISTSGVKITLDFHQISLPLLMCATLAVNVSTPRVTIRRESTTLFHASCGAMTLYLVNIGDPLMRGAAFTAQLIEESSTCWRRRCTTYLVTCCSTVAFFLVCSSIASVLSWTRTVLLIEECRAGLLLRRQAACLCT